MFKSAQEFQFVFLFCHRLNFSVVHVVAASRLSKQFSAVFRIRIHRIHMFLGHPDMDPLVRGVDPDPALDPDPSIIMLK